MFLLNLITYCATEQYLYWKISVKLTFSGSTFCYCTYFVDNRTFNMLSYDIFLMVSSNQSQNSITTFEPQNFKLIQKNKTTFFFSGIVNTTLPISYLSPFFIQIFTKIVWRFQFFLLINFLNKFLYTCYYDELCFHVKSWDKRYLGN